jgi:hypothetical protein
VKSISAPEASRSAATGLAAWMFNRICRYAPPPLERIASIEYLLLPMQSARTAQVVCGSTHSISGEAHVVPSRLLQVRRAFNAKRKSVAAWSEATELTIHVVRDLEPLLYFSVNVVY